MEVSAAKRTKMELAADTPSPAAGTTPPRPTKARWTPSVVNYRCKQKQYHSVLWSLQFLLALLQHYPHATQADSGNTEPDTSTAPKAGLSCDMDQRHQPSTSPQSGGGVGSELAKAVGAFLRAAEGAEGAFDVEGPLSASQLLALQKSFTDAEVRELCVVCMTAYTQSRSGPCRPLSHSAVFAAPTALMRRLWPTPRFCAHYARALADAHRHRIDHSDLLAMPGYLQEAGLHATRVFSGRLTDSATSVLESAEEQRAAEEWGRLIDAYTAFLPDRSHIHELENLPQEVAIGELLREAAAEAAGSSSSAGGGGGGAARPLDCVVDVGGGNGFLAAQVAERLGCDGVVVDPFFPAHAIDCCPRLWPDTTQRRRSPVRRRQTLHRTMALFRDVRWADVVPAPPDRTALIAKHLCGSGVDEVLRQLEAQGCLPRILVLAPCCFHRCSLETYIDPPFVSGLLRLHSADAFDHLTRLTDWNASVYQRLQGGAVEVQPARASKKSVRHLVSCPEGIAAAVEAVVNRGRVEWLEQRGYVVRLVQYVPDVVTPKNRCLVAWRPAPEASHSGELRRSNRKDAA